MIIRDVNMWRAHRTLPLAGGFLDQHPKFIAAIEVIEQEMKEIRERAVANEAAAKQQQFHRR